jgi:hypothetical protein
MKNKVLIASAALVGAATILGVGTTLLVEDLLLITKLGSASAILGLGSIGLFFVGLAYPRD